MHTQCSRIQKRPKVPQNDLSDYCGFKWGEMTVGDQLKWDTPRHTHPDTPTHPHTHTQKERESSPVQVSNDGFSTADRLWRVLGVQLREGRQHSQL